MENENKFESMMKIISILPTSTKEVAMDVMAAYCDELADQGKDIEKVYSDRIFLDKLIRNCK